MTYAGKATLEASSDPVFQSEMAAFDAHPDSVAVLCDHFVRRLQRVKILSLTVASDDRILTQDTPDFGFARRSNPLAHASILYRRRIESRRSCQFPNG